MLGTASCTRNLSAPGGPIWGAGDPGSVPVVTIKRSGGSRSKSVFPGNCDLSFRYLPDSPVQRTDARMSHLLPSTDPANSGQTSIGSKPSPSLPTRGIENKDLTGQAEQLLNSLQMIDGSSVDSPERRADIEVESRLAVVRLGIATSLFYALRTKHPGVAAHGLRVALFASGWAEAMGLDSNLRDRIEVAALLHDIGKIGTPDRILQKAGKLTEDEQLVMDQCPEAGCAILQGCTNDPDLLDIVRYANTWFDSRREDEGLRGEALPLGARMLAIVDAFDSMTTEHVYRAAMSRDRAMVELVHGSRTQFDPTLVVDFCKLLEARPELLQGNMVHRWLQHLRPEESESFWGADFKSTVAAGPKRTKSVRSETLFNLKLLRTLKDGVVFTDREGTITNWNVALEQMTGIASETVLGQKWSAESMHLRDSDNPAGEEHRCPLEACFVTQSAVRRAMVIEMPGNKPIPVHVEVSPVSGEKPGIMGAVIVIHDLSDREQLESRLAKLHEKTTLDPLTKVGNRSLMDDTLDQMLESASEDGKTFSAIICDIDHFKRINDTYGHQAGDEALVSFAAILSEHSRDGDLVARYGGEEFLLLASACDNATGAKRAEVLRKTLESVAMPSLDGEAITASFGVTEYQSGDTADTIIARADRALLKAKSNGRNRVVQLGLGKMSEVGEVKQTSGWFDWLTGRDEDKVTAINILTPVHIELAIEKLRGFIADHQAEIISVEENQLSIKVMSGSTPGGRRRVDHQIALHATLTLCEATAEDMQKEKANASGYTRVHLEIKPIRGRDRRRRELNAAVHQVISSFRCYLMGEIIEDEA